MVIFFNSCLLFFNFEFLIALFTIWEFYFVQIWMAKELDMCVSVGGVCVLTLEWFWSLEVTSEENLIKLL